MRHLISTVGKDVLLGVLIGVAVLVVSQFIIFCGLRSIVAMGLLGAVYGWMRTTYSHPPGRVANQRNPARVVFRATSSTYLTETACRLN